jgi:hypothetical protein
MIVSVAGCLYVTHLRMLFLKNEKEYLILEYHVR